jgi:atypical dual specificity phosphatase
MRGLYAQLVYYPTLAWNRLLSALIPGRNWFDAIDDTVILGALPIASVRRRFPDLGVTATVNTVKEWPGPIEEYAGSGITQLYLPTIDFMPPTLEHLQEGVAFIQQVREEGGKVYVHCKAGRGRSTTVVVCWLVHAAGMTPEEAQKHIESRRPHVNRDIWKREVVRRFSEEVDGP